MLIPAAERHIWLCVAPTDMRRSFDGLAALARNHLGEDPADGSWFVYVNRRRTIVKVLSFDGGGYWVWSSCQATLAQTTAASLANDLA